MPMLFIFTIWVVFSQTEEKSENSFLHLREI